MRPEAQSLVDHAIGAGHVQTPEDLDLVEQLAVEVTARREAYLDGLLERKAASVAISRAADWTKVATDLDNARRARAHRVEMLDTTPGPGDFVPGRPAA